MSLLAGLHGTVAGIIICGLLLVDEAGVPLPIAPCEGLLLLTGVLVASGAFPIWLIFPAAYVAMAAGMVAGYGWARAAGQSGLQALAQRVGATDAYHRVQSRLRSASPWGIAVSRVVPGLRPYATLVCGAAEVDVRTFLLGALPALLLWEVAWVLLGMLVGLPIAHFLGRFEKVALRGVILVALGTVMWFAIRQASDRRVGMARIAPRLRASLALAADTGMVASVVGGLFAIGRWALHSSTNIWIELATAAALLIVLLIAGRAIQTPGEALFDTNYWHHSPAAQP
jgi:membrane-associated protein